MLATTKIHQEHVAMKQQPDKKFFVQSAITCEISKFTGEEK